MEIFRWNFLNPLRKSFADRSWASVWASSSCLASRTRRGCRERPAVQRCRKSRVGHCCTTFGASHCAAAASAPCTRRCASSCRRRCKCAWDAVGNGSPDASPYAASTAATALHNKAACLNSTWISSELLKWQMEHNMNAGIRQNLRSNYDIIIQ